VQGRRGQVTRGGETHKGLKADFLRRFQGLFLEGSSQPGAKETVSKLSGGSDRF
jgi:hypothetical protein